MSENCTHDCSSCGSSCAERTQPQSLQAAPHAGSHIKHVIAVVSGKGGVGKSLVTSLMAAPRLQDGYPRRRYHGPVDSESLRPDRPRYGR